MSDSSVSSGDWNSIPHTCVTSAVPTEQSPQPHAVSTKLNVYISYDSVSTSTAFQLKYAHGFITKHAQDCSYDD